MKQNTSNILLTCLGYMSNANKKEHLLQVPAEQWQEVFALAQHHLVSSLFYHKLKSLKLDLPEDIEKESKQFYLSQAVENILLFRELSALLNLMTKKNVPVIVLKGAYLAGAVYDSVELRNMNDVDLLVKKRDLPLVQKELLAMGGEQKHCFHGFKAHDFHYAYKLFKGPQMLEIHWALNSSGDPCQIDLEGMWLRAQPVQLDQASALTLSPEDLILHLCLHAAKNAPYEMHIRMLCDIGEVIRRYEKALNWLEISFRAREWGMLRAVYLLMRLVREMLGAAVPDEWLSSLYPHDFNQYYLAFVRRQIIADRADFLSVMRVRSSAQLWRQNGVGRKNALLRARLLPSPEKMALRYRLSANSWRIYLYYPVRWIEIFRNHGALLFKLLIGDKKTREAASHDCEVEDLQNWLLSG